MFYVYVLFLSSYLNASLVFHFCSQASKRSDARLAAECVGLTSAHLLC